MDKKDKRSLMELDELDLNLIRELEIDARQSNIDLAAKLGTSATTIYRRLQKLLEGHVIRFFTMADPRVLGYHTQALVGINTLPGQVDSLAQYLVSCNSVRAINLTTGRYDMLVSTIHRSREDLLNFVDANLGHAPGLRSSETMVILKVVKASLRYLHNSNDSRKVTLRPLDELDMELIKELERDPRETITDLSLKLGTSRLAVSRKLQALLADNIISIGSLAKTSALGYHTQAAILIKAGNGAITDVASALAADTKINQIAIIAGQFDICAWATFRDARQMASFLRSDIGAIPGIIHHETMFQVGMPKLSLSLLT